jgi:hypothetical protein
VRSEARCGKIDDDNDDEVKEEEEEEEEVVVVVEKERGGGGHGHQVPHVRIACKQLLWVGEKIAYPRLIQQLVADNLPIMLQYHFAACSLDVQRGCP